MSYLENLSQIVNTKDYRRLHDKTQLFGVMKNDHYRSRITHTVEVCVVALQIAAKLREPENIVIDDSLIMAIAMGHDIGHTPFGHVGERTLSSILNGTENLDGVVSDIMQKSEKHWFKHNVNSYRILTRQDMLDSKEYLNDKRKPLIAWQVLDGVLKHTQVFKEDGLYGDLDDPYLLKRNFLCGDLAPNAKFIRNKYLSTISYHKNNIPLTVEGQIVAVADEIAQRVADFDDCVRFGLNEYVGNLSRRVIDNELRELLHSLYATMSNGDDEKIVNISKKVCEKLKFNLLEAVKLNKDRYNEKDEVQLDWVIDFDCALNKTFLKITDNAIKDEKIKKLDDEHDNVIKTLFAHYHENVGDIAEGQINYTFEDLKIYLSKNIRKLNEKETDCKLDEKELKKAFITVNLSKKVNFISGVIDIVKHRFTGKCNTTKELSNILSWLGEYKHFEILERTYCIILDNIAYYIAGMTDSYAKKKYKKCKKTKKKY